jgi:NAD(P)-dependent dehydrogenase (short-subunit alcohol dehydrogenase family)
MGEFEGKAVLVTGGALGIGQGIVRGFAREGAAVAISDVNAVAATALAAELSSAGSHVIAVIGDVSLPADAQRMVDETVAALGRLDVLVNNAGILRDNFLHKMTEEEWDLVIRVHLKGHWATLRHAADHWRARTKAGETVKGSVINTASASGTFLPNAGQGNYGAAKAAIAALTLVAAAELPRVGARANAIAPVARTRLTENVPGLVGEMMRKPEDPGAFDAFDPRHVSPLVAYLATADCTVNGKLFAVQGGAINEATGWRLGDAIQTDGDWTVESVTEALGGVAVA